MKYYEDNRAEYYRLGYEKASAAEKAHIRDYFAGQAMQALMSNPEHADMSIGEVAKWAYMQADVMIKTRGEVAA